MSGETEEQVSGWTTDTLHAHLQRLVEERDKRYEQRFLAQEQAIKKAEDQTEKRFEGVNEFRAALSDQARDYMPRKEYESQRDDVISRLTAIERRSEAERGRDAGVAQYVAYAIAVMSVAVAVAVAVLK